jgi:glycosyltransferase involved in cell wall biosynthesis
MNNNPISISVILPCYNSEVTLGRALQSIVDQSLTQWELIVIDDGSTDSSVSIVKQFQESYPDKIFLLQQSNEGPASTRNRGLEVARGEYIGFVDADDYVSPTMYEKMYEKAIQTRSEICVCGRTNILENSDRKEFNEYLPRIPKEVTHHSEFSSMISKLSPFVWDKIFKRELIVDHNIQFNSELKYAEDYHFLHRLVMKTHRISVIREPHYFYDKTGQSSLSGKLSYTMSDIIKSLTMINDLYLENGEFDKYRNQLFQISMRFYKRRLKEFDKSKNIKIKLYLVDLFIDYFNSYFIDEIIRLGIDASLLKKAKMHIKISTPKKIRDAIKYFLIYNSDSNS